MIIGFIVAAIVGYFAIHFFLKLIAGHSFLCFAAYCVVFGLIVLVLSFLLPPLPAASAMVAPLPFSRSLPLQNWNGSCPTLTSAPGSRTYPRLFLLAQLRRTPSLSPCIGVRMSLMGSLLPALQWSN